MAQQQRSTYTVLRVMIIVLDVVALAVGYNIVPEYPSLRIPELVRPSAVTTDHTTLCAMVSVPSSPITLTAANDGILDFYFCDVVDASVVALRLEIVVPCGNATVRHAVFSSAIRVEITLRAPDSPSADCPQVPHDARQRPRVFFQNVTTLGIVYITLHNTTDLFWYRSNASHEFYEEIQSGEPHLMNIFASNPLAPLGNISVIESALTYGFSTQCYLLCIAPNAASVNGPLTLRVLSSNLSLTLDDMRHSLDGMPRDASIGAGMISIPSVVVAQPNAEDNAEDRANLTVEVRGSIATMHTVEFYEFMVGASVLALGTRSLPVHNITGVRITFDSNVVDMRIHLKEHFALNKTDPYTVVPTSTIFVRHALGVTLNATSNTVSLSLRVPILYAGLLYYVAHNGEGASLPAPHKSDVAISVLRNTVRVVRAGGTRAMWNESVFVAPSTGLLTVTRARSEVASATPHGEFYVFADRNTVTHLLSFASHLDGRWICNVFLMPPRATRKLQISVSNNILLSELDRSTPLPSRVQRPVYTHSCVALLPSMDRTETAEATVDVAFVRNDVTVSHEVPSGGIFIAGKESISPDALFSFPVPWQEHTWRLMPPPRGLLWISTDNNRVNITHHAVETSSSTVSSLPASSGLWNMTGMVGVIGVYGLVQTASTSVVMVNSNNNNITLRMDPQCGGMSVAGVFIGAASAGGTVTVGRWLGNRVEMRSAADWTQMFGIVLAGTFAVPGNTSQLHPAALAALPSIIRDDKISLTFRRNIIELDLAFEQSGMNGALRATPFDVDNVTARGIYVGVVLCGAAGSNPVTRLEVTSNNILVGATPRSAVPVAIARLEGILVEHATLQSGDVLGLDDNSIVHRGGVSYSFCGIELQSVTVLPSSGSENGSVVHCVGNVVMTQTGGVPHMYWVQWVGLRMPLVDSSDGTHSVVRVEDNTITSHLAPLYVLRLNRLTRTVVPSMLAGCTIRSIIADSPAWQFVITTKIDINSCNRALSGVLYADDFVQPYGALSCPVLHYSGQSPSNALTARWGPFNASHVPMRPGDELILAAGLRGQPLSPDPGVTLELSCATRIMGPKSARQASVNGVVLRHTAAAAAAGGTALVVVANNTIQLDLVANYADTERQRTSEANGVVVNAPSSARKLRLSVEDVAVSLSGTFVACTAFLFNNVTEGNVSGSYVSIASGSPLTQGGMLRLDDESSRPMAQLVSSEGPSKYVSVVNTSAVLRSFYGATAVGVNVAAAPATFARVESCTLRLIAFGSNVVGVVVRVSDDPHVTLSTTSPATLIMDNTTITVTGVETLPSRIASSVFVGSIGAGTLRQNQLFVMRLHNNSFFVFPSTASGSATMYALRVALCHVALSDDTFDDNTFHVYTTGLLHSDDMLAAVSLFNLAVHSVVPAVLSGPLAVVWRRNVATVVSTVEANTTVAGFSAHALSFVDPLTIRLDHWAISVFGPAVAEDTTYDAYGVDNIAAIDVFDVGSMTALVFSNLTALVSMWSAVKTRVVRIYRLRTSDHVSFLDASVVCSGCGSEAAAVSLSEVVVPSVVISGGEWSVSVVHSFNGTLGSSSRRGDGLVVDGTSFVSSVNAEHVSIWTRCAALGTATASTAIRIMEATVDTLRVHNATLSVASENALVVALIRCAACRVVMVGEGSTVEVVPSGKNVTGAFNVVGLLIHNSPDVEYVVVSWMRRFSIDCSTRSTCGCALMSVDKCDAPASGNKRKIYMLDTLDPSSLSYTTFQPEDSSLPPLANGVDPYDARLCAAAALILDDCHRTDIVLSNVALPEGPGAGVVVRNSVNVTLNASYVAVQTAVALLQAVNSSSVAINAGPAVAVVFSNAVQAQYQSVFRFGNSTAAAVRIHDVHGRVPTSSRIARNFSFVSLDALSYFAGDGVPPTLAIANSSLELRDDSVCMFSLIQWYGYVGDASSLQRGGVSSRRIAEPHVALDTVHVAKGVVMTPMRIVAAAYPTPRGQTAAPAAAALTLKCVTWNEVVATADDALTICAADNVTVDNSLCPTTTTTATQLTNTSAAPITLMNGSTSTNMTVALNATSAPPTTTEAPRCTVPLVVEDISGKATGSASLTATTLSSLRDGARGQQFVSFPGEDLDAGKRFLWVRLAVSGPEGDVRRLWERSEYWHVSSLVLHTVQRDANASGVWAFLVLLEAPAAEFALAHDVTRPVAASLPECGGLAAVRFDVHISAMPTLISPGVVAAVTSTVGAVVVASTMLAGSGFAVSAGVSTAKLKGIVALSGCRFDHSETLDFITSPSHMCFGAEKGQCYRGGVVGSLAIVAGVCVGVVAIGALWAHIGSSASAANRRHARAASVRELLRKGLLLVHAPSVFLIPFALLGEGLVVTSTATIVHAVDVADYAIGVLGYAVVVGVLGYSWNVMRQFCCILIKRTLTEESPPGGTHSTVGENKRSWMTSSVKWVVRHDATQTIMFKVHHVHLFNDYRVYYYPTLELTLTCLFGVFEGLRISGSEATCLTSVVGVTLMTFVLLIFVVWKRPPLVAFEAVFLYLSSGVAAIASALLLIGSAQGSESVLSAAELAALSGMALNVIKMLISIVAGIVWMYHHLLQVRRAMVSRAALLFADGCDALAQPGKLTVEDHDSATSSGAGDVGMQLALDEKHIEQEPSRSEQVSVTIDSTKQSSASSSGPAVFHKRDLFEEIEQGLRHTAPVALAADVGSSAGDSGDDDIL